MLENTNDICPIVKVDLEEFSDDWVKVELFRWQYGTLPHGGDYRPLNISEGLKGMSRAIERGCKGEISKDEMPNPYNVCQVLDWCAEKLKGMK